MSQQNPTPKRIGLSRSSSRKGFQSPFKTTPAESPDLPLKTIEKPASLTPSRGQSQQTPNRSAPFRINTSARNLKRKFNSPVVAGASVEVAKKKSAIVEDEAKVTKEIEEYLEKGYKVEDCDKYMRMLHEYNDVKDAAQIIFGRLAELEGVTVKVIHERYGLSESD